MTEITVNVLKILGFFCWLGVTYSLLKVRPRRGKAANMTESRRKEHAAWAWFGILLAVVGTLLIGAASAG